MPRSNIPQNDRPLTLKEKLKTSYQYFRRTLIFLAIWLITVLLDLYFMSDFFLQLCVRNADTPLDVVKGYRNFYFVLIHFGLLSVIILVIIILVMVVVRIVAMNKPNYGQRNLFLLTTNNLTFLGVLGIVLVLGIFELLTAVITDAIVGLTGKYKQPSYSKKERIFSVFDADMFIMNMVLVVPLVFVFLIGREEEVMEVYHGYVEDVAAIESEELVSDVMFLHPDHEPSEMVIIGGNYSYISECYHAIRVEHDGPGSNVWQRIYVPDCLDFTINEERTYSEAYDVGWNQENAAIYEIQYTPNHQIVVEIEEK